MANKTEGEQKRENTSTAKKRSSSNLRDRRPAESGFADRVRGLAFKGLDPLEIAAQLRCPLERLLEPEMAALIQQAAAQGYEHLRTTLFLLAVEERNGTAVRFLMGPDRLRRLLSELDDLYEYRRGINDEYRAAIAAKDQVRAEELAGQLILIECIRKDIHQSLTDHVLDRLPGWPRRWKAARPPSRPRRPRTAATE